MKDGNQPKNPNDKMSPEQQEEEEFGKIKKQQLDENNFAGRNDTPRGSEPEQRGTSGGRT